MDIQSVGLFVLCQETGTEEQNNEFVTEFKKQFPEYVIEGCDEEWFEDIIVTEINKLDKENIDANKQIHKWVLVVPDPLPMCAEDATREEVEYAFINLNSGSKEEEEEFADICSGFYGCLGAEFWNKKNETMAEFVTRIVK